MDTSTLTKYIGSHDYVWVPIVAFSVIILIAGLIGFWNGWKTSLYFFGWNVVGLIAGVLSAGAIIGALENIEIVGKLLDAVKDLAGPLIIFIFMVITNFFAFLIYFIFRKKLKKSIKINKKAGKSNKASRFIGAGIAVASSAPMAVFLSSTTGMMSEDNGFTKFMDKMTKGFTAGKYEGSGDIRTATLSIAHLADVFGNIGNINDVNNIDTGKAHEALENLVNSGAIDSVDTIYDAAKDNKNLKGALDSINDLKDKDLKNIPSDIKIKVTPEQEGKLKDMLGKILADNHNVKVDDVFDKIAVVQQ